VTAVTPLGRRDRTFYPTVAALPCSQYFHPPSLLSMKTAHSAQMHSSAKFKSEQLAVPVEQ
jgi:hypothetical protein